ncbi:urease accessory protein ureE [Enterobacter cloacae]|uniref:Urease accessory protein ureE n=1 Tax=Enterobacter cloacae TaxID=550 RepID=A0A377LSP4_ENTCL|nr:urease accessory protein ureE [Enterobacter cloacae]
MIYLTQRLDHAHPITASVTLPIDVRVKSRARVALNDGAKPGSCCRAVYCCAAATCSVTKTAAKSSK